MCPDTSSQRYGEHTHRIDGACIVWLPATTGVEGGLIEHDHMVTVVDRAVDNFSGKSGHMGIVPVEFRGHCNVHGWCERKLSMVRTSSHFR
jgi:hypothetical protein